MGAKNKSGKRSTTPWDDLSESTQRALTAAWDWGMPQVMPALYGRWWQLETWLRSLVYVELCAKYGTHWDSVLPKQSGARQLNDQAFRYMATPDVYDVLSYTDVSPLFDLIDQHWDLFAPTLLQRDVWRGRVVELKQIRNRIGHCRRPHSDDLGRLEQTLRDLNDGAIEAVCAFNRQEKANPNWRDSLSRSWAGKPAELGSMIHHAERQYNATFELRYSRRPWNRDAEGDGIDGKPGFIWHAFWYVGAGQTADIRKLWSEISPLRDAFIFVCVHSTSAIDISFPAVDDADTISKMIGYLFSPVLYSIDQRPKFEDFEDWPPRDSGLDSRIQIWTPWSEIDESMHPLSVFGA